MKKHAFLYNPAARAGSAEALLKDLKNLIKPFPNYEIFVSENPGQISNLIAELEDEFDVFVACGGDGTVQEVAANIIHTNNTLGILPVGTGNDLCKTLNIPKNLNKAFDTLKNGNTRKIDVGKCNDFIFLNTLGFGFDGLTNQYALDYVKLPSFLRYAISALKASWNHKKFTAEINYSDQSNEQRELIMLSLANGRVEGGNFWIAPDASITDGKLDMVTIDPISRGLIPLLLPFIVFKQIRKIPYVKSKQVNSLSVSFDENVRIHADGEIINCGERKFVIEIMAKAISVICDP